MYSRVREVLKKYGVKGTTFTDLVKETELTKDELYQIIGQGLRCGGFECYEVDGTRFYRNRPRREQIFGKNEWSILRK